MESIAGYDDIGDRYGRGRGDVLHDSHPVDSGLRRVAEGQPPGVHILHPSLMVFSLHPDDSMFGRFAMLRGPVDSNTPIRCRTSS